MNNGILLHCCSNSHLNLDMDMPRISTPELVLLLSWTVFIWGWSVSFHLSKHQSNMLQSIWWKCHVSASNSTQMLLWKNPNHHWCDAATHLVRNSLLSIKLTGFDTKRTTASRIRSTRFTRLKTLRWPTTKTGMWGNFSTSVFRCWDDSMKTTYTQSQTWISYYSTHKHTKTRCDMLILFHFNWIWLSLTISVQMTTLTLL